MSIWTYAAQEGNLEQVRADIARMRCAYCRTALTTPRNDYGLKSDEYRFVCESRRTVKCCATCGWWTVRQWNSRHRGDLFSPDYSHAVRGASGILRQLDLTDQTEPLAHVRQYLAARYDARFAIHPKRLEEVVVAVYRDLGYDVEATGRTGDGGIDAVLRCGDRAIGVQVKRHRGKIEAESIRSFAGALYLRGMPAGIYVTTSGFTRGARETAAVAERRMRIVLVDATTFYGQLGITQRAAYDSVSDPAAPYSIAELLLVSRHSLKP